LQRKEKSAQIRMRGFGRKLSTRYDDSACEEGQLRKLDERRPKNLKKKGEESGRKVAEEKA